MRHLPILKWSLALGSVLFTASVTGTDGPWKGNTDAFNPRYHGFVPGEHDPAVGGAIFTGLHALLLERKLNDPEWISLAAMASKVAYWWGHMQRS